MIDCSEMINIAQNSYVKVTLWSTSSISRENIIIMTIQKPAYGPRPTKTNKNRPQLARIGQKLSELAGNGRNCPACVRKANNAKYLCLVS